MNNLASYDAEWEQMERDRIAAEAAAAEKKHRKRRQKALDEAEKASKDVHEE